MSIDPAIFQRHIRPLTPLASGAPSRLERMRRFGAVLCDVYGTLLISASGDIGVSREPAATVAGLPDLLRRHGIDRSPTELAAALHRSVAEEHEAGRRRGIDYPEVDILRVWQRVLGCDDPRRLQRFALEYELVVNPVYPMPGFKALLAACRERRLPTGIISNAQFYTPLVLEWFLGSSFAEAGLDPRLIFLSYRFGCAKPSTVMFERAAEVLTRIGVPVSAAVYVGNDMLNDIRPAQAAGFSTALFAGDRRSLRLRASDHRCRDLVPDLIVTDLRQLIAGIANP